MTGGRGEGSVMCLRMGWTTPTCWTMPGPLLPAPGLDLCWMFVTWIGRCYLLLWRGEMYFKCEFPICHQSMLLPAKHTEPASALHHWLRRERNANACHPHAREKSSCWRPRAGHSPGFCPPMLCFPHVGTTDSMILEYWQVSSI